MIAINQIGKIVLFLVPIPNWRIEQYLLYKKDGLINIINEKKRKKRTMANNVWFFDIMDL